MRLAKEKCYSIHVIFLIITLACFCMNEFLRGGLPLNNTLEQRIIFIDNNNLIWSVSWCIWMFAALGLFTFFVILADDIERTFMRTVGLTLVAIGMIPDLIAEVIYAFVIPEIIDQKIPPQTIGVFETLATYLTGYLGNGLYNIGGIILTVLAINQGLFKGWVAIWGIISWFFGLMLSLSVASGLLQAAEFFTASSMILSTTWMLVFAYKVIKLE